MFFARQDNDSNQMETESINEPKKSCLDPFSSHQEPVTEKIFEITQKYAQTFPKFNLVPGKFLCFCCVKLIEQKVSFFLP